MTKPSFLTFSILQASSRSIPVCFVSKFDPVTPPVVFEPACFATAALLAAACLYACTKALPTTCEPTSSTCAINLCAYNINSTQELKMLGVLPLSVQCMLKGCLSPVKRFSRKSSYRYFRLADSACLSKLPEPSPLGRTNGQPSSCEISDTRQIYCYGECRLNLLARNISHRH